MPDIKQPGDPDCLCSVLHLDAESLKDGPGHCLCSCHGEGRHVGNPCPCNTVRDE